MRPWFACCLALLLVAGCDATATGSATSAGQPILGGVLSDSTEDAVLKIAAVQSISTQNCTGALVAPNLVITARHCVADYVDLSFTCNADGDLIAGPGGEIGTVVAPEKISLKSGTWPDSKTVIAVGKQVFGIQTTTICRNDLALVMLDRNLTDLPLLPIRLDRGTTVGERVRVVGYGISDDPDAGFGVRHTKADLVVTKVGKSQYRPTADDIPPRSFQLDGGGICIGDSGGPAISEQGAVIGVDSKFTGPCNSDTTVTYYTETGPFSDVLIRPAFEAAGYEPILEAMPGVAGTAGTAGSGNGIAGASPVGSGGTSGTDTVGAGTAGTYIDQTAHGGAPVTTSATVADGGEDLVYEGGPPKGGACACRAVGERGPNINWLLALAWFLFARRIGPVREPLRTSRQGCRQRHD